MELNAKVLENTGHIAVRLDLKVVDDILKKVKELNQTAKDIEDIALQLRKRVYNDMETETFANKKEDTKNEILINQNPVQCNLCD